MSLEPPACDPAAAKRPSEGVLVAPRRPITRYRPAVIAAFAGVVVLVIGAGFILGMGHTAARHEAPPEPAAGASEGPSPIEARLPARYDDPAVLVPPGGASASEGAPPAPSATPAPATPAPEPPAPEPPDVQRARQETLAARASPPFFNAAGGGGPQTRPQPDATAPGDPSAGLATAPQTTSLATAGPISAKDQFIAAAAVRGPQAPILPRPPLSPWEVKAGALVSAALVTGINSDLPGPIIAQVTEPVYDHLTGRHILIPQGARLIGRYDSQVGYGQERVLVVWTQMVFPSGRTVDLGAMVGLDAAGLSGLTGKTDRHLPVLARAIGLSTLISIGGAAAQNSASRRGDLVVVQDAAGGVAAAASQTGQRLVERDLQRAPTLRIAPGQLVRVLIDRDLVLPPEGPTSR